MASSLVLNSIFFDCRDYTLDPFWKELFTRCAYNKFPKGIKYDKANNTISISSKNSRRERFSLPTQSEEVFSVMMRVFRSIGIRSPRDLEIKKEELEAIRQELCVDLNCLWKELKPKYLKDRMIVRYVLSLQKTHQLSQKEAKKLLTTIQLGFQLKQLGSDDVKYEKGKIIEIDGLKIDEKAHTFTITRPIKPSKKNSKSSRTDAFLQMFENHLKEVKKTRLRL